MVTQLTPDAEIACLASRQAGVMTRHQALDLGLTARQIELRLASGLWRRQFRNLYVLTAVPTTWSTWAWAGVLTGGVGSALVGGSAAAVCRWYPTQFPITIGVATGRRPPWPPSKLRAIGLNVPASDVVRIDGLPVTNRLRTAVDVAHLLPMASAQGVIDRMLVLEKFDLASFSAAVDASSRNGCRQARQLARSAEDRAASKAERMSHRLLRRAGLGHFVTNYPIACGGRTYIVDLAFVRERVVIEIQGWAFHQLPEQRRADDVKSARLQRAGWLVIRLTWHDLLTRSDEVVAEVRAALARP